MIFIQKVKTGIKDIGKNNTIKNRAILEMLENVGSYHSDKIGYGAVNIEKTKLTWILLEWKLKVIKRPIYGQTLTINTWGRNMEKFFTYRDYEIYDENDNLCVIATSKWVLINIETGKIFRMTDDIINSYQPEERNVFSSVNIETINIPDSFDLTMKYTVKRRDIDLNFHMHNLYYLDLAYEALPVKIYEQRPFDNIRITYKKEIKLGDIINCKYKKQDDKNIVVITDEEDKIIHAIISLENDKK